MDQWLVDIDTDPQTIDTDLMVAAVVALHPERVWSRTDLLHLLSEDRDLADIRDAFDELASLGYLVELVEIECGDRCSDPLCGDSLVSIHTGN
ncbi:hypothetical protein [Gordonia terrae]